MVDVSKKQVTQRQAIASAVVRVRPDVLDLIMDAALHKGDALTTAKIAGINAAKLTSRLIPMCHALPIEWVDVTFERAEEGALRILATAKTAARTGVEMEALTAASVAALTIYDMAKSADKAMVIGPVRLEQKSGGRGGTLRRNG